jgi:hypothetical protein
VLVGEEVLVEGQFPPNTELTFTLSDDGVVVDTQVLTAEADGSLDITIVFEPADVGSWRLQAESEEVQCTVFVDLVVTPAGSFTSVGVSTLICPPEIQSVAQLEAAGIGDACDVGLLPEDHNPPAPGFTSNLVEAVFDFDLTAANGLVRSIEDAVLDGGSICDPVAQVCTGGFSYRWDFVVSGDAQLDLFGPDGYRLGHVVVSTVETKPPQAIASSVDFGAESVTFTVPETAIFAQVFWFTGASAPASTPTPAQLPDTRTSQPMDGAPLSLPIAFVFGLSAVGVLTVHARRYIGTPSRR